MTFRSIIPILGILLCCSVRLQGQDREEHIFEDSSILYPQEEVETTVTDTPEEEYSENVISDEATPVFYLDTSLLKNSNHLSPDSVRLLKNDQQFSYAGVLDSMLKAQRKQELQASKPANDSPSWLELFFSSAITKYVFWILAVFFIGFIIVKLFMSGGFFQRATAASRVKTVDEEDHTPATYRNYDVLIANARKEGNYRLATRYLYLQLLQKLVAIGAIEYTPDKTNAAYLSELTGKPYKSEVARLTLNYEYVWYGEFVIDSTLFNQVETAFKNLQL